MKKRKIGLILVVATLFFDIVSTNQVTQNPKKMLLDKTHFLAFKNNKLHYSKESAANNSIAFLVITIVISGGFMISNLINNYYFKKYSNALVLKGAESQSYRSKNLKFPLPQR